MRRRLSLAIILSSLVLAVSLHGLPTFPKITESIPGLLPEMYTRAVVVAEVTGIPLNRVKITEWQPDTCSCIIEYAWDKATLNTPEARQHYPVRIKACPVHDLRGPGWTDSDWTSDRSIRPSISAMVGNVWAENRAKNVEVGRLSTALGVDPREIRWSYATGRRLRLAVPARLRGELALARMAVPGIEVQ